jgi:endonuclease/exonuclease/phosphatase (EEP) superfamily protein YafD
MLFSKASMAVIAAATLFSLNTLAAYQIPADDQVLNHLGNCQQAGLPTTFNFFDWNIKKAEAKDAWAQDFTNFVSKSDLVFIQEAMMDSYMPNIVKAQNNFCWDFAASFLYDNADSTGVLSGATSPAAKVLFLRSPGRESVIKTPKMTLVTEYQMAGTNQTLMVANIHALNATSNELNREQVEEVAKVLRTHNGPMIFSGDFNSWNGGRIAHLDEILTPIGMVKVAFSSDSRKLKLDHIYVRGLEVLNSDIHEDIDSSDHKPLTARMRLAL